MQYGSKVDDYLKKIADLFERLQGENLVGIYLHGSLVMGCFNPVGSDVDFLVVVKDKLSPEMRQCIADEMIRLVPEEPGRGVEMSVVRQDVLNPFQHPTPFEMHFSDYWIEKYKNRELDLSIEHTDPDLIAHGMIIRHRGKVLVGKPIEEVFGEIPAAEYLASLAVDAKYNYESIQKEEDGATCEVPKYAVLNFCRVLAYINEQKVTSKAEGGEWGLQNLPGKYHPIIQEAYNEYTKVGSSRPVDTTLLKEFASYAYERISSAADAAAEQWADSPKISL